MEGVPFVGNDACAHNLLLKGRPLIMRLQQLLPGSPSLGKNPWSVPLSAAAQGERCRRHDDTQVEQRHSETPLCILNAKISSDEDYSRQPHVRRHRTTVLPALDLLNKPVFTAVWLTNPFLNALLSRRLSCQPRQQWHTLKSSEFLRREAIR
jgi:hypothetical protein